MARFAFAFNHAVVLGNESLRQGQAQASATIAARYQGVKNAFTDVARNARAVIDNFQFNGHSISLTRQRDLPFCAGSEVQLAVSLVLPLHGLDGIAGNVEHRLYEFFSIAYEFG